MKALMLLCSLVTVIPAAQIQGKVVGVKSGNALEILQDGKVMEVKIFGIDCPAKSEPMGRAARRSLADQVFMAEVRLEVVATEADGRLVGKVTLADGKSLGAELLRAGMAWWDKQAAPAETALAKVEKSARDAYLGLWSGASEADETDWRKEIIARRENTDKIASAVLAASERN
jgi:micrococcal nuclease